jgi:LCP family protein required for cell wall assembly
MNLRKFYLIISLTLAFFLSVSGIVIISNLNAVVADTSVIPDDEYNPELILDEEVPDDTNNNNNNNPTKPKPDFEDIESKPITKSRPVNILIVGSDSTSGNTDTILVVNYNPSTLELNILSIPRDTRVKLNGTYHKINFAYPSGGSSSLASALNNLLGMKIDRYIFLDVSVFRDIIDALGGVEYTIPVDMKYDDAAQGLHIDLKAGKQLLDGAKAEQFIRFRKPNTFSGQPSNFSQYYTGSDLNRVKAQQDFFKEVIRQKVTVRNLPNLVKSLDIIFNNLKTDFMLNEILVYIDGIEKIEDIKLFVLSGTEKTINGVWYYDYNGKILHDGTSMDSDSVIGKYFSSKFE